METTTDIEEVRAMTIDIGALLVLRAAASSLEHAAMRLRVLGSAQSAAATMGTARAVRAELARLDELLDELVSGLDAGEAGEAYDPEAES